MELYSITKGFLPPRLTTMQRNAIVSPAEGLTIYNLTKKCFEWSNGIFWFNGCGIQDSSGGSAYVFSYNCTGGATGVLNKDLNASGVTQKMTAVVDTLGTYDISAIANGITFSDSGSFINKGPQDIILTASGIPSNIEIST